MQLYDAAKGAQFNAEGLDQKGKSESSCPSVLEEPIVDLGNIFSKSLWDTRSPHTCIRAAQNQALEWEPLSVSLSLQSPHHQGNGSYPKENYLWRPGKYQAEKKVV